MPPVRIAILSDDRLVSEGLLRIIGAEARFIVVDSNEEVSPQVVLLDSRMNGALDLCVALLQDGEPAVIFVAAPDDNQWGTEALAAGARGILPKTARPEDMVRAIRVVVDGLIWAPRRVLVARIDLLAGVAKRTDEGIFEKHLSSREREVFRQAATGLGNKELAGRLDISEATVKVHMTHIFQKLGLHGRGELAAAYHGVIRLKT